MYFRRDFIIFAVILFLCATSVADFTNCTVDLYSGSRANIDDSLKITDEFTGTSGSGSVFGKEAAHFDGHERFVQEGAHPIFQKIGFLAFVDDSHCTATLVGECHLLTAGHCLSRVDIKGRIIEDKTGPIAFRSSDGKTEAAVTEVKTGGQKGHRYTADKQEDWGFVALDRPIGKHLGWMAVQNTTEKDMFSNPNLSSAGSSIYTIAGFSADLKKGEKMSVDPKAEFIFGGGPNIALYRGDMFFGSSGGPVFRLNSKGVPEIYAIQTAVQNDDDKLPGKTKDGRKTPLRVGHYSSNDTAHLNIALTSSAFLSELKKFIATHPCPQAPK